MTNSATGFVISMTCLTCLDCTDDDYVMSPYDFFNWKYCYIVTRICEEREACKNGNCINYFFLHIRKKLPLDITITNKPYRCNAWWSLCINQIFDRQILEVNSP